jgi:succinate dehydrogenase / fumarate reductase membrane anchor subunit
MRYLTDRKRAVGRGAAHTGTEHHWSMQMSAVALAVMIPTWMYIFGHALGGSRADVLATFARPFPAILTGLVLVVGMRHFAKGATMALQDYVHGTALKMSIMAVTSLAGVIAATGLFALIKIAL